METKKARESLYKKRIKKNLINVLESGYIPELGTYKKGKVRDVHFTSEKVGKPIIMVASDRVSAFDHLLNKSIPYKGKVLNLFAKWVFENTSDIVDNALIETPNDTVVIQKKCKNLNFEFIVRGYVWGSLAGAYEKGERDFCGLKLPEGLLRYEKLKEPLFTPTTKTDSDENVTFADVEKKIGKPLARKAKNISFKLYERASKLAEKNGYIFLDTKYEFGVDEKGKLRLIDEANTPDSSRYCEIKEYEKFKDIQKEMKTGKYKDVSELLSRKPKLKIKELSKQFVRDVLEESGFSYKSSGKVPELTDEQVIETSYRYIALYEDITGKIFDFGDDTDVKQSLISSLIRDSYIKGGLAVMMAGSDSDADHLKSIKTELNKYDIASVVRIASAHKQGEQCTQIVNEYNKSIEPVLIIAVAGGTDALSGLASFHSVWPVVSCPPKRDEYASCLANPPGSANAVILRQGNVAKFTAQYFGQTNPTYHKKIESDNKNKIQGLENADEKAREGKLL